MGLSNLCTLVMICKSWLEDAQLGAAMCIKNVDGLFNNEANLLDEAEEDLDEVCLLKKMWSRVPCVL